jgi:hypothetical protein
MSDRNCLKLKKKESRYSHNQADNNNNGNRDRENYDSQDVIFVITSKNMKFTKYIWICYSRAYGHYCKSSKGMFNVKEIKESIKVGNSKNIIENESKAYYLIYLALRLYSLLHEQYAV